MRKRFYFEHTGEGIILALVLITMLASTNVAWAIEETFPSRPIHIWVGWEAGGSTDTLIRLAAPIAEKHLGQRIVVENRPGGTGSVMAGLLKNAKPDGYTLGATYDSPMTRVPHLVKVDYDPMGDFTYIIGMGDPMTGMVVRSDSPFKKFQDIIEFARKNPGKLTHGITGMYANNHLAIVKIASLEKINVQHVAFKGSAPTISALLGGHIMIASMVASTFLPHVKTGALRPLIIYDTGGLREMPEIPTLKTLGYDFEVPGTQMIVAPKGVPKLIVDKLASAFYESTLSPQYQKMAKEGAISLPSKPLAGEDLYKSAEKQFKFYGELIKEMGLKKE